jgi:hypothetical protein
VHRLGLVFVELPGLYRSLHRLYVRRLHAAQRLWILQHDRFVRER